MMKRRLLSLIATILFLVACTPKEEPHQIIVSLVADGRERTFSYTVPVTVEEFLRDAGVERTDLDRVNPQPYTQISDGMRVTVVRVTQEINCQQNPIPFRQRTVPNEGLQPGEQRL